MDLLRCALALVVLLVRSGDGASLRSCTKHGQLRVPCEDELLLAKSDRFLLTLFGHSCYTMSIVSPQPLEVLFYDSRDLKGGRKSDPSVRRLQDAATAETNETRNSLAALGDNRACHNVLSCYQLQEGLSKATVYNLMISRWSNATEDELELDQDQDEDPIRVTVELEHCDPVSPWHYVGLVFVGGVGFTSTLLLLCIVGEFVFGLRTLTKLQNGTHGERFVELAQIDPLKELKESEEDGEEPDEPLITTATTLTSKLTVEPDSPSPASKKEPFV